ncbi:type II toxin-antitoxin system death-on-curing family toxin [Candidatus Saccharibacteria bacterium CG_4_10_14_0_2_um_filter_52_9]|nr:MAG: type II toxin-antitoxin system death-on-curing family toxin [Candidatus Saccharibacteria bacterium CG_4_10_14_0_2_um_filter_52_9]
MRFVSLSEIVVIHDRIIAEIGGSTGIREPGLLVAIAEKPLAGFGGQELYPSLFDKAAALFEALCNYHVFVDGNKRTAITALEYFLHQNGYHLTADKSQKEHFTLDTAMNNTDLKKIATWIKKHSKRTPKPTLNKLLKGVTPEKVQGEIDWGPDRGKEKGSK